MWVLLVTYMRASSKRYWLSLRLVNPFWPNWQSKSRGNWKKINYFINYDNKGGSIFLAKGKERATFFFPWNLRLFWGMLGGWIIIENSLMWKVGLKIRRLMSFDFKRLSWSLLISLLLIVCKIVDRWDMWNLFWMELRLTF